MSKKEVVSMVLSLLKKGLRRVFRWIQGFAKRYAAWRHEGACRRKDYLRKGFMKDNTLLVHSELHGTWISSANKKRSFSGWEETHGFVEGFPNWEELTDLSKVYRVGR